MTKPTSYLNWTDGAGTKIRAPTTPEGLLGFSAIAPSFKIHNWLLYFCDLWIQWFDFLNTASNRFAIIVANTTAAFPVATYMADVTLGAFTLTLPLAGSNSGTEFSAKNIAIASGNLLTVAPSTVAFTATLTSGLKTLGSISSTVGLGQGQAVSGTGIPAGTTLVNTGGVFSLSANATASGSTALTASDNIEGVAANVTLGAGDILKFKSDGLGTYWLF